MKKIATMIALLMLASSFAYAHSGGTNKDGCHHDRKTGAITVIEALPRGLSYGQG